jgi:hypothetical protein
VVRFSETVYSTGTQPFICSSRINGTRYAFSLSLLDAQNERRRFIIQSITPANAVSFAKEGDTVWIDTAAHVTDNLGNAQSNPQNRRVLLNVNWPAPNWQLTISSNPFTPFTTPLPVGYGSGGNATGTAIIIRPTTPMDAGQMNGTIVIYDALGNKVVDAALRSKNDEFFYTWNGTNRQNRIVGTGTYLGVMSILENNNLVFARKTKIGVKR